MLAVLNFVGDQDDPAGILSALHQRLAPGSYLAASHGAREDEELVRGIEPSYQQASAQAVLRTRKEVERPLAGWQVQRLGVVFGARWPGTVSAPRTRMTFAVLTQALPPS